MDSPSIFYSWQSDTSAAANRSLIGNALENVAREIRADRAVALMPEVTRDTQGAPVSPDIADTILAKIDAAAIVVADVTLTNQGPDGKRTPNSNVVFEVGYAFKSLGPDRIILVMNTAFGIPEDLPFDLRKRRALTYRSEPNATGRADARKELESKLSTKIREILGGLPAKVTSPVSLTMDYVVEKREKEQHDYRLELTIVNVGEKEIRDWSLTLELPTACLSRHTVFALKVGSQSDAVKSFFRWSKTNTGVWFYPGDKHNFAIQYSVDESIHRDVELMTNFIVTMKFYTDEGLAAEGKKPFGKLQEC
ncbi:MAG: hypothetical protein JNM63_00200 [Spirochaetia bacterium]|nr:hypothetical protein [Spirochaetia bacterium]